MTSEEIMNKITKLANGEIPNGKFQLRRMYGAYEREQEKVQIIDKFKEKITSSNCYIEDTILLSDTEAVCVVRVRTHGKDDRVMYQPVILSKGHSNILCKTLDEAIITLMCMKHNCEGAASYIMKMLQD